MLRRRAPGGGVLPEVPERARAFAYRPYCASFAGDESGTVCAGDGSDSDAAGPAAKIVWRAPTADSERLQMGRLQAHAADRRIREARSLVDDARFEFACDAVYECQRGFNFLGRASYSAKLLHPMDPPPWCDAAMRLTLPNVHSFQLPDPSWEWVSPRWLIDMTLDVDDDGWQYASRFASSATWHGRHSGSRSFVRRRRWLRLRRRRRPSEAETEAIAADSPQCDANQCVNEGWDLAAPVRRRRSSAPKDMATKIKCKISRNYVGTSPKGPLAHTSAPRTYTLKDGQYRSHRTRGTARPATPPPSPAQPPLVACDDGGLPVADPRAAPHILFADESGTSSSKAGPPDPVVEQLQLRLSLAGVGAQRHWRQASDQQSMRSSVAMHERIRDALLALPTGGVRGQQLGGLSRVPSIERDMHGGSVAGVPKHFPRLTSLMAPEPTVPRDDDDDGGSGIARPASRMLGEYMLADDSDAAAVDCKRSRPSRLRLWGGLASGRGSAVALGQSAPTSPQSVRRQIRAQSMYEPMPVPPPSSPADGNRSPVEVGAAAAAEEPMVASPVSPLDGDGASSTATTSHLSLVIAGRDRRSQLEPLLLPASPTSIELSRTSSMTSESFHRGESPQLHPYVDPYAARDLPLFSGVPGGEDSTGVREATVVDKAVVALASDALREMLEEVALDRERLDVVHECLRLGGVTAAAVWYSLPWLHFDALQYDSARQRLIALLLAAAHTCPPDALAYFASAQCTRRCDEAVLMRSMSAHDLNEHQELMADIARGGCPTLSLSQAWRLVVRPLVAQDADLFYSDFKRMLVGVARWSLATTQHPQPAATTTTA